MKEIQLTKGRVALVDDEDFEEISKYKWHIHSSGYAVRHKNKEDGSDTKVYMHREILKLNIGDGLDVDHIDSAKLNNQKNNLRICNRSENNCNKTSYATNTSGYKGVSWHKVGKKWMARIQVNNVDKYLGLYSNVEDAYAAYCLAALELHGKYANHGHGCIILKGEK